MFSSMASGCRAAQILRSASGLKASNRVSRTWVLFRFDVVCLRNEPANFPDEPPLGLGFDILITRPQKPRDTLSRIDRSAERSHLILFLIPELAKTRSLVHAFSLFSGFKRGTTKPRIPDIAGDLNWGPRPSPVLMLNVRVLSNGMRQS